MDGSAAMGVAFVLLPLTGLVGLVWAVVVRWTPRVLPVVAFVQAVGVAVTTAVLVLYVRGEDDYRDNGMSRWAAYGAQEITVTAIVLAIGAVALLLAASLLRQRGLAILGFLGSTAAAVVVFLAILANSLN